MTESGGRGPDGGQREVAGNKWKGRQREKVARIVGAS